MISEKIGRLQVIAKELFLTDGSSLLTNSRDDTLKILDLRMYNVVATFKYVETRYLLYLNAHIAIYFL